ncbi:cell division protein FtsZ [candidate division WOR-3 bacterium]|uniref:Cell division protein FtsZ n=1 Tax=candidate division WOR-3 bacterium TaxID=2052148 RepID=A0A9D5K8N7_UNCW3|nr:cell division protein FtsZ [candidate division WOR-3 bacterium]MBD3364503.1 cell division protein FtsZ [candidate division WOR-3 bacterium]
MFAPVEENRYQAQIGVMGLGGAGGNAIDHMIERGLPGVRFFALNTDVQALDRSKAEHKIQLGPTLTRGLGSGGNPEIGRQATEESADQIKEVLNDLDMIFIAAGEGGGTGTGAAPMIAELAQSLSILTVSVVTRPFDFEGPVRKRQALEGTELLRQYSDTLIIIPNQKLLSVIPQNMTLKDSFKMADEVLFNATRGVTDLITGTGMINLDFADVRTIMSYRGSAVIGIGSSKGENRAVDAAQKAVTSPLIEDFDISGAKGILLNISGGEDLTLHEVQEAAEIIYGYANQDSNIIFGAIQDKEFEDEIRVSVIATGVEEMPQRVDKVEELLHPGLESSDAKVPTYMRRGKSNQRSYEKVEPKPLSEEDLDIPTFLRRQFD